MIDLRKRSNEKELMDAENIPFKAMEQTLKELNIINTPPRRPCNYVERIKTIYFKPKSADGLRDRMWWRR